MSRNIIFCSFPIVSFEESVPRSPRKCLEGLKGNESDEAVYRPFAKLEH